MITNHIRSLWEGNFFSYVCLSTWGGEYLYSIIALVPLPLCRARPPYRAWPWRFRPCPPKIVETWTSLYRDPLTSDMFKCVHCGAHTVGKVVSCLFVWYYTQFSWCLWSKDGRILDVGHCKGLFTRNVFSPCPLLLPLLNVLFIVIRIMERKCDCHSVHYSHCHFWHSAKQYRW